VPTGVGSKWSKYEERCLNIVNLLNRQKITDLLETNMNQMQKIIVASMSQTKKELEKKISKKIASIDKVGQSIDWIVYEYFKNQKSKLN
jgi:hypothetical protein